MKIYILSILCLFTALSVVVAQHELSIQTVNINSDATTVSVPVVFTPDGMSDISVFQYSINWDENVLNFQSISDFGINALDENDFGKPSDTGFSDKLNVGWENYPSFATLATPTTLFQINFTINESAMASSTDITFCSDCPQEFYDAAVQAINVNYSNGVVATTALPLVWNIFSAETINNKEVVLSWETQAVINVDYFVVERKNATNWEKINTEKINIQTTDRYQFIDRNPAKGENIYRIKQIDVDGRFNYSPLRRASVIGSSSTVYTNPFEQVLDVTYVSSQEKTTLVQILNLEGKTVFEQNLKMTAGENKLQYNLSHLASGLYWMKIGDDSFKVVKK
ncbi:MAG: T9SS type A sorting domain-containing protein [Saprospiraceae bacterium]